MVFILSKRVYVHAESKQKKKISVALEKEIKKFLSYFF